MREPIDFYRAIDRLRSRPALWLGDNSLTALDHYLGGYADALRDLHVEVSCEPPFRHFSDWVFKQYELQWGSAKGWRRLILERFSDERAALDEFFVLIDRFRSRRRIPVAIAVLASHHRNTGRRTRQVQSEGCWETLPPPLEIRVVRFAPDNDVYATLIYGVDRKDSNGFPIDSEDHYSSFDEAVASFELEFGLQASEWIVGQG